MKFINTRHLNDGFSALICAIISIFATILIVTSAAILYPFAIFFFLSSLFFTDIFIWHFWGKEIISINETELEIKKVGRLFKRKKKIQLHQIKDIYLWQKKVRDIHIYLALWDISWQGTLCVKYEDNKKYYIGMNMSDWEADELREELMQEIKYHVDNVAKTKKEYEYLENDL